MKFFVKFLKYLLIVTVFAALLGAAAVFGVYRYYLPQLPSTAQLRDTRLQTPLRVYASDGSLIAEFGEQRRIPLHFEQIPAPMVQAFLAAEDDQFFTHPGVDHMGLIRAAIEYARTGKKKQGGSTITMQVVKNYLLSREKSFERKFKEILLSLQIERELSKQEIFELYANKIFFGNRAYGVGAAAQVYYGRPPEELSLAQTAMIAGLPKAPSDFNPLRNPERALERRDYVLRRMHELGFISSAERTAASDAPISAKLHTTQVDIEAPYLAEMVRAEMFERYGEAAYTEGFGVHTTLDGRLQGAAASSLRKALDDYERRHGYRGPEDSLAQLPDEPAKRLALLAQRPTIEGLPPALVTAIDAQSVTVCLVDGETVRLPWSALKWASKRLSVNYVDKKPKKAGDILKVGDIVRVQPFEEDDEPHWRLAQLPEVSGAFISLEPKSGAILALMGGYDFYYSKFNRVTQAKRQPGSGFKAVVYSAALDNGYTAASLVLDQPIVATNEKSPDGLWRPRNAGGKWGGPTRIRNALKRSRNLVSIRLVRDLGIGTVVKQAGKFGFDPDELQRDLTLALGSTAVTPLQMARAYSVLANGGFLIDPYFIERIERDGETLFQAQPRLACPTCPLESDPPADTDQATPAEHQAPRTLSPETRFLMYSMMQDVINSGTATRAKVLGRNDIAGKTGTTNNQRDAWFNGYNQDLVAIAWVGYDSNEELGRGEYGGRAALPAWIGFMREALRDLPERPPEPPATMVEVRIDPKTGKLAANGQQDAIFEYFQEDRVPKQINASTTSAATPAGGGGLVEELF